MQHRPLPFERDDRDSGAIVMLTLEQPERPVVVLDRALLGRLESTLDQIQKEIGDGLKGLVIASGSDRVFVAGADLREIDGLTDDQLDQYLTLGQRLFGRIAALPCTSVAAINGAALGGGLELAMHCDILLGLDPGESSKPYRVGLPEASLGLCPGWGGTNLLPARIEPDVAIQFTASGKPMDQADARRRGLLEELHPDKASLLRAAKEMAAKPKPKRSKPAEPLCIAQEEAREAAADALRRVEGDLPDTEAAKTVARCVREGVERGYASALEMERRELIRLRSTDAAKEKLEAFFERSGKT